MDSITVVGLIGLALILVAWIAETVDLIIKKKGKLDTKFAMFYIMGSIVLLVYSIQIKSLVFVILKVFVIILSFISLYYSLKLHKKKR